jgi:hypothetical protein
MTALIFQKDPHEISVKTNGSFGLLDNSWREVFFLPVIGLLLNRILQG